MKANRLGKWARAGSVTVGAVMLVLSPHAAMAQAGSSATVGATVKIASPLVVNAVQNLRFGALSSNGSFGTVTVTISNARSTTGGAEPLGLADFYRAEFIVTGPPGASYSIVLPTNVTSERDGSSPEPGVTSLNVVNLVSFSTTANAETLTGVIGPGGSDEIYVGGTIEVPGSAMTGSYRGDIALTVEFQ